MALSSAEKEMQCVLHWFSSWCPIQKQKFLRDLLDKLVPNNMDTLFASMNSMNVRDKPPSIFQCQLKLFSEWFSEWTNSERNDFMFKLRGIDAAFAIKFEEEATRLSQH